MIAPVGICLSRSRNRERPLLYYLATLGREDSIIRDNTGSVIAFASKRNCASAMKRIQSDMPATVRCHFNFEASFNPPRAVELLLKSQTDEEAIILNCINNLLDFISTGSFAPPIGYRQLHSLANWLTFHDDLSDFKSRNLRLSSVLLWTAGAALAQLRILRTDDEFTSVEKSLHAALPR